MYGPERTEILIACRNFDPNSDNFAILYDSAVALAKKEAKRRKPHWKLATETILVLELVDRFRLEFAYLQVLFGEAPTWTSIRRSERLQGPFPLDGGAV
jgi:hypothetical protein